jgi:hypothetical protein
VDLVLAAGFHLAVNEDARPVVSAVLRLAGFVVDPYAQGEIPMGASVDLSRLPGGGVVPDPTPGATVDVSTASVSAIARAVLDLVQTSMRSNDPTDLGKEIQKLAKNGDNEALASHPQLPAFLADQNALLSVLENGLYQWAKDRAYEGDMAAEAGEPKAGAETTAGPTGEHTNAQEIAGH